MDWAKDLSDWPMSAHSRRVRCGAADWHVQEMGSGACLLLLHGAGATTHSWRGLMPILAKTHRVVAIDLPGHGFTRPATRMRRGLPEMAADIAALSEAEGWTPACVIGHSAGAAIALEMAARDPAHAPPAIVGINAALEGFDGVAGLLFPAIAKLLALNPFTALMFSAGGDPEARARRLLTGTGSAPDDETVALYARLIADRDHVDGALQMMAQWNVERLLPKLPSIPSRCLLIAGTADKAVPPEVSARAAERLPDARLELVEGAGHLLHEADPELVAALIRDHLGR